MACIWPASTEWALTMKRDLSLWHTTAYRTQGDTLIANAWRNPNTTCWRCGLTHAQYAATHGTKASRSRTRGDPVASRGRQDCGRC
jgi:hypothetical protein